MENNCFSRSIIEAITFSHHVVCNSSSCALIFRTYMAIFSWILFRLCPPPPPSGSHFPFSQRNNWTLFIINIETALYFFMHSCRMWWLSRSTSWRTTAGSVSSVRIATSSVRRGVSLPHTLLRWVRSYYNFCSGGWAFGILCSGGWPYCTLYFGGWAYCTICTAGIAFCALCSGREPSAHSSQLRRVSLPHTLLRWVSLLCPLFSWVSLLRSLPRGLSLLHTLLSSVVDPTNCCLFFGSGSGFNHNFGYGSRSGLFMKNTFELQIIQTSKKSWFF